MFAAVALFVILLLAILYVAFMRFGDPPPPTPIPDTPTAMYRPRPLATGVAGGTFGVVRGIFGVAGGTSVIPSTARDPHSAPAGPTLNG